MERCAVRESAARVRRCAPSLRDHREGLFPNGGVYQGSVEEKIDEAFNGVGIEVNSRRIDRCQGAKP